jgi:hypothetical protein
VKQDDDIIRSTEDLRKALGGKIPVFEVAKLPELSDAEKRKIQLEAIKRSRNNKGKEK